MDVSNFKITLDSLNEVITLFDENKSDKILRDSLIQRFEYVYSISLKMLKRYLKENSSVVENVDSLSFNDLIRHSSKIGLLLNDLEMWDTYRSRRNLTSHTYNEQIAIQVCEIIPNFYKDAEFLYENLKKRL